MSNLIQVPKSKEDIAAFLADGNARPAPFVTNADVNDGDILGATRTIDVGGGSYKFSITLPSGRPLESAPIGPDYSKRDATFQWADAVRSAIIGDAGEAEEAAYEAARKRESLDIPPQASVGQGDVGGGSAGAPDTGAGFQRGVSPADPVEYAKEQLRAALQRLAAVASAEADVERWTRVVAAFSGDIVPKGTKRRKRRKHKKSPSDWA